MAGAALVLSNGKLWHPRARRRARGAALVRAAAHPAAGRRFAAPSGIAVVYANRAFSMDDAHQPVALPQTCRCAGMAEAVRPVLKTREKYFTRMIVSAALLRLSKRSQRA